MKVSLVVLSAGKSAGQAIPVTLAQFIIGRDPQCNLRPASAVISKRHCAILIKNGKVSVRDFDSTNGTFVNETPVKGEFPLNHEDILKVGPLAFRVVIEKTTPVNKPTPPPAKSAATDDDDVAAMLLSLQEDPVEGEPSGTGEDSDVPGGSTIMDMVPLPPETATEIPKAQANPAAAAKPASAAAPTKPAAAKPAPGKNPAPAAPPAAPATAPTPAAEAAKTEEKPAEKPGDKKPQPAGGNARDAARAILEKYAKRPRG